MKINTKTGTITVRPHNGKSRARILISGDCCIRGTGEERVLDGESFDILEPMFNTFQAADVSMIQFETVLTEDDTPIIKSGPNLKSHPETIDFFHAWGGDIALLANNHTGDFGPEPLMQTMEMLHAEGFKTVGAGANLEDASQPLYFETNDISIGILNVAENEFGTAALDKAGSAPLVPMYNITQIAEIKRKANVCIVVVHGGNEYNPIPSPRVVLMSRAFAEAGADAVINIHTHCPQGIEIWKKTPIIYSLGNFFFPASGFMKHCEPDNFWFTGYSVALNMDCKGCASLEIIPTTFAVDSSYVKPLEGKQKTGFFAYLQEISDFLNDWEAIIKAHECWAARSSYSNIITNPSWKKEDFKDRRPENLKKLMPLRNIFTCEAHNELLTTYLRLFEENRLEEALEFWPVIEKYTKAKFML